MRKWLNSLPRHDRLLVIVTILLGLATPGLVWVAQVNDGKMNRWANETLGTSFDVSPQRFKESRL
jgi:hypothetical protein